MWRGLFSNEHAIGKTLGATAAIAGLPEIPAKSPDRRVTGGASQIRRFLVDVSRAREVLRNEGPGGLMIRALRKTARSVLWFERVAFYDTDLTQAPARLSPLSVEVEFRVATPSELCNRHSAALDAGFQLSPQDVEQRLARSHVAVLGLHEGVVIAMTWLAFNAQKVSEVGATMRLRPGEVLTYNEATLPAWRGRGISPHLNQFADEYARQQAATRRINWRRLGNAPALRVAAKLGDRLFSVATNVRMMGVPHALVFGLKSAELLSLVR